MQIFLVVPGFKLQGAVFSQFHNVIVPYAPAFFGLYTVIRLDIIGLRSVYQKIGIIIFAIVYNLLSGFLIA